MCNIIIPARSVENETDVSTTQNRQISEGKIAAANGEMFYF